MGKLVMQILLPLGALLAAMASSAQHEATKLAQLPIVPLDLTTIPDGLHRGGITFSNQPIEATVRTVDHRIVEIQLRGFPGDVFAKTTEGVVTQIKMTQAITAPADTSGSYLQRAYRLSAVHAIQNALQDLPASRSSVIAARGPSGHLFLLAFWLGCWSLGSHVAGFLAFRSRMFAMARGFVLMDKFAFGVATASCLVALLLALL